MRSTLHWKGFCAAALFGGLMLAGCKSAPELTQAQGLSLVQADYDHGQAQGISIQVSDLGMRQGATAKYWDRTKVFPNRYWADFKLTPDGKKVVQLPGGGDTIEWRPDSADDSHYSVRMITAQANHLKARNMGDITDEMVAGVDTAKGADFTEGVDLSGVPDALQEIARNPGNQLSTKRHVDFALVNGAWTVHSIQ